MKILIVARNLVIDISGPRYAFELSNELVKMHNEVFILTSNVGASIEGAKILKLQAKHSKRYLAPIFYSFFAKVIKTKYNLDVVHGNGYTFLDDVTTVHFLREAFKRQLGIIGYPIKNSGSIEEKLDKVLLRSSKHLIAVSSLVKCDLMKLYGIPDERITVVHNGVSTQEFSIPSNSEKMELRQKYGLNENKILLLFIGGSSYKRKGFMFLCRALPKISKDVDVVAVCKKLSGEYYELLSKNGLSNRIKIIEYIPNISEIYKAVDIFVLPTIYDPFPLAVLEAMASGLPVIVSSYAGSIDIIKNWKNGVIVDDPSKIDELTDAINELAKSDSVRRQMGLNARLTAEKLSWSNVVKRVTEIYQAIVKS